MNKALLRQVREAVLYEGHLLYPYRPTSRKNCRERFTFGRVYPEAYSVAQNGCEPCVIQAECLVKAGSGSMKLQIDAGFLQPQAREVGLHTEARSENTAQYELVPELRVDGKVFQPWLEALERTVVANPICLKQGEPRTEVERFSFADSRQLERIAKPDGSGAGVVARRVDGISGTLEVTAEPLVNNLFKIRVRLLNQTPVSGAELGRPELVTLRTFASANVSLAVSGGEFISLLEPPKEHKEAAGECRNMGVWPVLIGEEEKQERELMLASPIILYDYPKIAPESAGPLFDGTEIDEILTLRILTLTEEEKDEMRNVDDHARRLLERTEQLNPECLLRMHGVMRSAPQGAAIEFDDFFGGRKVVTRAAVGERNVQAGDRVRIKPKGRADVMDLALSGKTAVIEAIEEDLERRIHLALVLDDDPGKELGFERQTAHRFFFGVDEVEVME